MDYSAIIKKSWHYIKSHRVLWWLGIFAALTEGSGGGFTSNWSGSSSDFNLPNNNTQSMEPIKQQIADKFHNFPKVLGTSSQDSWATVSNFFENHSAYVLIFVILFLIISVIIAYLSFSARASLIASVDNLEANKPINNFSDNFKQGFKYGWKIYGLYIIFGLIILSCVAIFALPIFYIISAGENGNVALLLLLFLTGGTLITVLSIFLGLIIKFAERIIVLTNSSVFESFTKARELVFKKISVSIITLLVSIGLNILFGMIIALVFIAPLAVIFGFLFIGDSANYSLLIIPAIIGGIILFSLALFLNGIFAAFSSSYWTISYRALDYLANTENK